MTGSTASSGLLLKQAWRCQNIADFSSPLHCQRQGTGGCFLSIKIHFLHICFWISWKRRYQPKGECVISLDGMKLLSTKSIIIHRNNQKIVTHNSWYKNSLQDSFRWKDQTYMYVITCSFLTQPKVLL